MFSMEMARQPRRSQAAKCVLSIQLRKCGPWESENKHSFCLVFVLFCFISFYHKTIISLGVGNLVTSPISCWDLCPSTHILFILERSFPTWTGFSHVWEILKFFCCKNYLFFIVLTSFPSLSPFPVEFELKDTYMLSTHTHYWAGLRFFFHIPCQHDQTFWILNIGFPSLWKNNLRTRELVQCLITHTTLPEDPSSIPSTHIRKKPPLPTRSLFSFTQW